jgi:hypothetical protein
MTTALHNDYPGLLADPADGYDDTIADTATTIAAELGLEWGLDWADDTDLAITWIKIAQYARWIASRNLGNIQATGRLDHDTWEHIAHATGLNLQALTTNYPPEQGL